MSVGLGAILFARLTGDVTVGGIVGDRVFPDKSREAMQNRMPQVVYQLGALDGGSTYTGSAGNSNQKAVLTCMADTYAGMETLANAVRVLLENTRGAWGTNVVQGSFIEGDEVQDTYEIGESAGVKTVFPRELTVSIWFIP